jgi:hypothetical protein
MNWSLYFGGVFLALVVFSTVLVLIARSSKRVFLPMKPVWAGLLILAAVVLAGTVCSIVGNDRRILFWWLLGLPVAAVCFPLIFILTTLCTSTFWWVVDRLWKRNTM